MWSQVNMAFVDMLDLLSGQDNVDGFKSFNHFWEWKKKMKNFSPVKSIDQTLPTKSWRSSQMQVYALKYCLRSYILK